MKKALLLLSLLVVGVTSMYAESHVTINTSCGVSVDMIYEDYHTSADVMHDTLILEEYFCG